LYYSSGITAFLSYELEEIMKTIDASIFRAYDIRGIVDEQLSEATVFLVGKALGTLALEAKQSSIITARDGRLSGQRLMSALQKGILSSGCDVIDVGQVPTPVLYFATHVLHTQSGAMLTGSHNPPNYNGIKMVVAGKTLFGEDILEIYKRIIDGNLQEGKGTLKPELIEEQYLFRIVSDVELKRSLKVVVDCGNGIAGKIAPELYRRLGCEVIELFCEVDGNFPNHHPDPSQMENLEDLIQAVAYHQADLGLAFDGDGDRLGVVTNEGEVIWPDRQLMLYAIDVLSRNPGAMIIYDVKSTKHLHPLITLHKGNPLMWKTGHSFVKSKLKETGALLAGEMSGHTFFKERWYGFDDGIYTGARLLEILSQQTTTAAEIFRQIPNSVNTPELKLPVEESKKFALMEKLQNEMKFEGANITIIDGVRADFKEGWGLVRASNTTPYLILRFEADDQAALGFVQELFREQLLRIDADLELPF
jgi:phosphomannomutase/phosphoglucomutase